MAILKFQVASVADSLLPKHRLVNTLHFNSALGVEKSGADRLCTDLANIFQNVWWGPVAREIDVRAYEVAVGPDGPPVGSAIINAGATPMSSGPREVALCLSYYATVNRPRTRGRIYLPVLEQANMHRRPDTQMMLKALKLVPALAALGGADINWVVHSRVSNTNPGVTHAWVDNEWDTVRSRGLPATTRETATTGG